MKDDGYKWRYQVERKKVRELQASLRYLKRALDIEMKAHAKASDAWFIAEQRFDKIYARYTALAEGKGEEK